MKSKCTLILLLCLFSLLAPANANFDLLPIDTSISLNLPVAPADSCQNAPPFCGSYLQGYCSVNEGYTAGGQSDLSGLGCSIENNQWLTFVPCDDSVSFVFSVSNCSNLEGLEFHVLSTSDCIDFAEASSCFGIGEGLTDTLVVGGLTIGGTYYLMVDGINGDVCRWQVKQASGISDGGYSQENNTPGHIEGEGQICLGAAGPPSGDFTYTAIGPICTLTPMDTDCGGNPACPPASQQFCGSGFDTVRQVASYDTVWTITPSGAGHFVNGDSIGELVDIVWDSVGTFLLDADLVPAEYDTVIVSCTRACGFICPDDQPCGILPKEINVGMPDTYFEAITICEGACGAAFDSVFCEAGQYEWTGTDEAGCVDTFVVVVTETPLIFTQEFFTVCPGGCVPYLGGTYCAGTHQVQLGQCEWVELLVDEIEAPAVSITGNPLLTCAEPTTLLLAAVDYPGAYTLTWNGPGVGGSGTEEIEVSEPGTYVAEVFFNGCFISEAFTVSADMEEEIFELGEIGLCPGECFELLGNQYCAAGSYSEQFTDPGNGCTDTYFFTIFFNENMGPLSIGAVSEICDGISENYTIGFDISGGATPYYIDGVLIAGNFYQSAPIPTGQSYAFTVADSYACGVQQQLVSGSFSCQCISVAGSMATAAMNLCEDETAQAAWGNDAVLDPNDGLVFVLHTGSGSLGTVLATNLTGEFGFDPGAMQFGQAYYISAVAGNELGGSVDFGDACLSVSAGQPVTFYSIPTLTLFPAPQIDCRNPSSVLEANVSGGSGQFSFQWSGPNGFSSGSASPSVGQGGAYTCLIIDETSGCSAEQTINVEEDFAEPDLEVSGGEISCNNPAAALLAASQTPGVVFDWHFPTGETESAPGITAAQGGTYGVVATAPNGCTSAGSFFVNENLDPPNLQASGAEINCNSPVAALSAFSGQPDVSFVWVFPNGNQQSGVAINASTAGAYQVQATGSNGCTSELTVEVTENLTPPDLELTSGEITCDQTSVALEAISNTGGVQVNWVFPSGNEVSGLLVQTSQVGSYTVTATAPNGCTSQMQTSVSADADVPVFEVTGGVLDCTNPSIVLEATSNLPGIAYTWTLPDGTQIDGATLPTDMGGEYTVVATAANGCSAQQIATVVDNADLPDVQLNEGELTCDSLSATLTATSAMPGVDVQWIYPDGSQVVGNQIVTGLAGEYTVIVTAPNGCSAQATTTVIQNNSPPDLQVSASFISCDQPTATLVANSSVQTIVFEWTLPDGTTSTDPVLNTELPGNYSLLAIAANGCQAETTTTVELLSSDNLSFDLLAEAPVCFGDENGMIRVSDVVNGSPPFTYFVNGTEMPNDVFGGLPAGQYEISVTDANGCKADTIVDLTAPAEVAVELGDNLFIDLGEHVTLNFQSNINAAQITWTGPAGQHWEGASEIDLQPKESGRYQILIADEKGCTAEDDLRVFVNGQGKVFIPNAFTPNGDMNNDFLTVFAGEDVTEIRSFRVYDRWGELLFKGENFKPNVPAIGWDGKNDGKDMRPAVYVYVAEVEFLTGQMEVFKGDVVLIR